MSKIYFDAQLREDGTVWLVNLQYDPESFETCCYNNHLIVTLEASTYFQGGKQLQAMYEEALDSGYSYSVKAGEAHGLTRYIEYMIKDGRRPANHDEYLVTMKDEKVPLRLLRVESPSVVREQGGGGVTHSFMYNDFMQVEVHYRKYILKDWAQIEQSMRAYIDQLYAEAKRGSDVSSITY